MAIKYREHIPWTTLTLAAAMGTIFLTSPTITTLSYTALAPWMHAGLNHLLQNLVVFVLLGTWVERRVGRPTFLFFTVLVPYLALYLPVALDYGDLSRGASGLTMALTGYSIPVLCVFLLNSVEAFESEVREVIIWGGALLVLFYLTAEGLMTVQRFVGVESHPDDVAVSVHATGLILGVLWFGWRASRHGLGEA